MVLPTTRSVEEPTPEPPAPRHRPKRGLTGIGRVWLLTIAMMVTALGVYLTVAQDITSPSPPFTIPWWALMALFFITETNVIRVRYHGQRQSFPLNEIPLVFGLFFSSVPELLLGLLLGSALSLVRARRQSPLQLAFNTSHFFLGGVLATLVFHEIIGNEPLGPLGWSAALLAMIIMTVGGHATITAATVLSGSHPQVDRLRQVLSLGLTSSITTTMIALAGVELLWRDARAAILLVVPAAVGFIIYRGYLEGRARTDSLDVAYESTRMLYRSPEVEAAVVGLLTQARAMFRAERAEITLHPGRDDEQAVRTSLGPGTAVEAMVPVDLDPGERAWAETLPEGDGVLYTSHADETIPSLYDRGIRSAMVLVIRRDGRIAGTILVGNRVGEDDHFDQSDLKLFEPLARNLGVVLESGSLDQSLQQLRDLEAQLRHQAYHDPLTALANRSQFIERVELALGTSSADPSTIAVLFIGIDDFKAVNESLGHPVGDRMLVALAGRIKQALELGAIAARLGGDEFGVLLDCTGPSDAARVAEKALGAIRRPIVLDGDELHVRASIGIATGSSARRADELLRNAGVAMASAKSEGKNRIQLFDPDMHRAALERQEMIADLQRAVERDEFELHYQPIVDLATAKIVALEALVRWNHPRRGQISPDFFIPAAEETGLILAMGRLIMTKACAQAREWQERYPGHRELSMAINLSARQLQQVSFVGETMQLIAESGISAHTLILEITETVLMDDTQSHITKLAQLKSLGLRLAMDDFGTGYSSLSFLSQLPIDILKIAKPFVEGLGRSQKDQAFAAAIVRLGHTVGMSLIAEGVERSDQLDELRRLGCDMVQGWYLAKAGDATATEELLVKDLGQGGRKVIPFPA